MIKMPGKNFSGPLPPLTEEQKALSSQFKRDVDMLAGVIGERNLWTYENLTAAAGFLEKSLTDAGYTIRGQEYQVEGKTSSNLEAQITGVKKPDEILVVGAHYDSVFGCPGANDNGSAVAATLALARMFTDTSPARTLRFVFFVNEEPPFFQTERMGSMVYAKECKQKKENIVGMLSLETIGYYSDRPGSQQYPFPFSLFYPSTGDFIGFVSNVSSRRWLRTVIGSFRRQASFPSQGGAFPEIVPGIGWSDQWSFWRHGYPAVMITDTAPFRYPWYHSSEDTPDKIDCDRLARVTSGLEKVIRELVNQ